MNEQPTWPGLRVRFADFEADFGTGELRKGGVKIKIDGQPLRVLAVLLEHPGEIVTRDRLKEQLWPSEVFVDFEHGINEAVKRLREALGDSAETPRFIETIRRRGYRFIHPIEEPEQRRHHDRAAAAAGLAAMAVVLMLMAGSSLRLNDSTGTAVQPDVLLSNAEMGRRVVSGGGMPTWQKASYRRSPTADPSAHEAYLKGVFYLESAAGRGMERSIEEFRRAVGIDPGFALAWTALADAYNRAAIRYCRPSREAYVLAQAAVSRALELDDSSPEAHVMAGVVAFRFSHDWALAERQLGRALELDPNSSRAHLAYATFLGSRGRVDEALREARTALSLEPVAPQRRLNLAWQLQFAGRHEEAIEQLESVLLLSPTDGLIRSLLGRSYSQVGRTSEALESCDDAIRLATREVEVLSNCGIVYARAARDAEARRLLKSLLEWPFESPYHAALVLDALGEVERAAEALERAFETRAPEVPFFWRAVWSEPMRAHPRFRRLLARLSIGKVDELGRPIALSSDDRKRVAEGQDQGKGRQPDARRALRAQ